MSARKVAVLMGGLSSEREISLKTGSQIIKALQRKGYDAVGIDAAEDLVERLKAEDPDVCFVALHGRFGEDGTVQGLLELLGYAYTGSGVLASALGMDKIASKKIFKADGIPTPDFTIARGDEFAADPRGIEERILLEVGLPLVVKPSREGSTIGMTIVRTAPQLGKALKCAFQFDESALAERFISGTEVTVGILGNDKLQALPTMEITTKTGFYDYKAKYTKGLSQHIIPARIPEEQRQHAQELAIKAHRAIGCCGFSRVDLIVDKRGKPYVLEVNTIPGMTELSLFPEAARAAGIEFDDLVERIVEMALEGGSKSVRSAEALAD